MRTRAQAIPSGLNALDSPDYPTKEVTRQQEAGKPYGASPTKRLGT